MFYEGGGQLSVGRGTEGEIIVFSLNQRRRPDFLHYVKGWTRFFNWGFLICVGNGVFETERGPEFFMLSKGDQNFFSVCLGGTSFFSNR